MSSFTTLPIAIVGAACRLPGKARSLDSLWTILAEGKDAVSEVPTSRWETSSYLHPRRDMPGHTVSVRAGIVEDIYHFDPAFFGISRTEAESMDPQQRLLLELTWEALEDAGIPPSTLSGTDTAVFVGAASPDAGTSHADDICATTPYSMTGTNLSIISNRISYIFNFHGPSMTIDTACSSAMHALHQACQELASGGAGMAVAGGVNALLAPYPFVGFSQAHMLSPDGCCKVFDAAGDGYVRAEGGGIVLLQPLETALAQGRRIHAVIRGIGCNSDGRTQGIALPSASAQEELLRGVYDAACCRPEQLAYVEAHGTGTAAGDPVEAKTIGKALGQQRQRPLWVGSIKCNVGHLETASAMAGLMKALLVLRERRIPPQIHLRHINPAIDCKRLNLRFPLRTVHLPRVDGLPCIGLNSFGFGGANGHVLLEAAGSSPRRRRIHAVPPIFLSARSATSLRTLASAYAERIDSSPEDYFDLASGAVFRRDMLSQRLVVEGDTPHDIAESLREFSSEMDVPYNAAMGESMPASTGLLRTAFVFSGNGGHWTGMGREMLKNPAFAARAREVAALMKPLSGRDLLETLCTATSEDMTHTDTAQQLLFLVQAGLCAALDAVGIRADAAFGHSVGEVAAAWYSGALSLKDAVRVIYYRSLHQERTRGTGRMAAAGIGPKEASKLALRYGDIEVAAINAADSVTLSGDGESLIRLVNDLKSQRIFSKILPLNYAFHSSRMDRIRQGLLADLHGLRMRVPQRHFISSVTGKELTERCPASYWWENVRRPVCFSDAVQTALNMGIRHFLEIGPHSILLRYLRSGLSRAECADGKAVDGWVGGTLSRNGGPEHLKNAWRSAWTHGWPLDMTRHFPSPGHAIDLPSYPWNNEDCRSAATSECSGYVVNRSDHPLLGRRLPGQAVWENVLDLESSPWIGDHKVGEAVYYPAAAFLEMYLAAARKVSGSASQVAIFNTSILRPIIFREKQPMVLRTVVDATDGEIRILARPYMHSDPWTLHARGRMMHAEAAPNMYSEVNHPEDFGSPVQAEELYRITQKANMQYGPVFRPVDCCWRRSNEFLARFLPPADSTEPQWEKGMLVPPPLLDGGLQLLFPLIEEWLDRYPAPRLPYWFGRCILFHPGRPAFAVVRRVRASRRTVVCMMSLLDPDGTELLRMESSHAKTVEHLAAPRPSAFATYLVPQPHPQSLLPNDWMRPEYLSSAIRLHAKTLTDSEAWQHYRDEILPLREMAGICLARELEGKKSDSCPPQLAARLRQRLNERGQAIAASLPSFTDVWRTLMEEAPGFAAANMLLSNVQKSLLHNVPPTPKDSFLWAEYRRQEYRQDSLLVEFALKNILSDASSPARILEIGALPASLDRLMAPGLRGHCRVLAASNEADFKQLALAREGLDLAPTDAPLDVLCWDAERTPAPLKAHAAVAFHCLHRADDLPATLRHCRESLHAGGIFILAESAPNLAEDMLFGQDAAWWSASDESGASRLLAPEEWRHALLHAGFEDIEEIRPDPAVPRFLLLCRAAGTAIPTETHQPAPSAAWLICTDDGVPSVVNDLLCKTAVSAGDKGDAVIHLKSGKMLRRRGETWQCQPDNAAHWKAIWKALAAMGRPIVCIDALGITGDGLDWKAAHRQCTALTQMARGWDMAGRPAASLRLLTLGAMACTDAVDRLLPAQAAAIGAARVLMNEMPALEVSCIDLHITGDVQSDDALTEQAMLELMQPTNEREIMLSGMRRYVARSTEAAFTPQKTGGTLQLECEVPGRLETLRWKPVPLREPDAGQVRVKVQAVGLNFRDVMWAMNMLPEEALENGFSGPGLGIECAGTVDAVGKGVDSVSPGQKVLCFGPHCFAGHVLTTAQAVTPIPGDWSFASAATVPVAFFTAWYALKHLAHLQPGERLLIHGAAGGVGLAAVQIASTLGLEIYATAGNEDKRNILRLLGVKHVYDSRSLAFHDKILADTDGQGVDAVLNSLAGEGMDQSLRLLRPFGRFLELGKRDFYADNPLRLRPFRDNVSFFGIDVDQLMKEKPSLGLHIFREIMEHFLSGDWSPLPHSLYAPGEVEYAYRAMQQSRHVGKIVVEPPSVPPAAAFSPSGTALPVRPDGSYIVSGGLAGFGLATARRLAQLGAGALILLSRHGATPKNASAVSELRRLGLPSGKERPVIALAQDVTDMDGLACQLDAALSGLPPLRGILHAAAVLDDCMLTDLTPERLFRVLAPKLGGACNLHRYSLGKRLDFFVMYSSATTMLGNPGQANYVAANMGLECLAAMRRSMGLPGLAVCWGAIGDAGMLTRDKHALESLRRITGISPLAAADALDALERLPADGHFAPALFAADWKKLSHMPLGRMPRFAPLRTEDENGGEHDLSLRDMISGLPEEEALARVTDVVASAVARILRVPASSLKHGTSLADMGMDSLMAVELVLSLEERLDGLSLSGGLSAGSCIRDVAARIYTLLSGKDNIGGDMRTTLEASHNIVISDDLAKKVFNDAEARHE